MSSLHHEIESSPPPRRTVRARLRRLNVERKRTAGWSGLLYILPALVLLILFEVWPLILGGWISLWRWDIRAIEFIGLDNYRRIVQDDFITRDYAGRLTIGGVLNSLIVTFYYAAITVPIALFGGFGIAYLLFRGRRGEGALRTIYFLPHITASVAVTAVFVWIFDARSGIANAALERIGLSPQRWLADPTPALDVLVGGTPLPEWASGPSMALMVVIFYGIWTSLGFNVVIYLAGLTSISKDVLEAAKMDGAGEWSLVRHMIWPLISPTTYFLLITSSIGAFKVFDPIFALTRSASATGSEAGGPIDSTLTITVYIYRYFYERQNSVGYASAVAMLLFVILLAFSLFQIKIGARRVHYQ